MWRVKHSVTEYLKDSKIVFACIASAVFHWKMMNDVYSKQLTHYTILAKFSIFTFRADFVDKFLDDLLWEWIEPGIDELAVSQARGQGVSLILGEKEKKIKKFSERIETSSRNVAFVLSTLSHIH
jgi:hypothetical protein